MTLRFDAMFFLCLTCFGLFSFFFPSSFRHCVIGKRPQEVIPARRPAGIRACLTRRSMGGEGIVFVNERVVK